MFMRPVGAGIAVSLLAALGAYAVPARPLVLELEADSGEVELLSSGPGRPLVSVRRPLAPDRRLAIPEGCIEGAVYWVRSETAVSRPIVIAERSACRDGEPHAVSLLPAVRVSGTLEGRGATNDDEVGRVFAPESVSLLHDPSAAAAVAAFDLPPGGTVEVPVP